MLKMSDEFKQPSLAATPGLDDLEREALETVYRPPSQHSREDALPRFSMDEAMLIDAQQVHRMLRTVVLDIQTSGHSEKRLFRRSLKQHPL